MPQCVRQGDVVRADVESAKWTGRGSEARARQAALISPAGWAIALALALVVPAGLRGQAPASPQPDPAPPARLATLARWADEVWLSFLDRDGSFFGRLADEGTFQRFNPLMDAEYELDLVTGLFSPAEEARWATVREGLRVSGASINHPFILNVADWLEEAAISGRVDLLARYRRTRNLTTQRDYPWVGIAWRADTAGSWRLHTGLGTHFFKASADVELGVSYRRRAPGSALVVAVRLAALDAFNNVIFDALGVEPEETPAHFSYSTLPFALRLGVERAASTWRVELHGGITNRSVVEVTFPASGDSAYTLAERGGFAGALLELALGRRVAVAGYATLARATTGRRFEAANSRDLDLRETSRGIGARAVFALSSALAVETDLSFLWRPEDRDAGDGSTVRHRDRQWHAQASLVRRPAMGWLWRLGYVAMDRRAGPLASALTAMNHRLLMEGGHRFASGFEVVAGLRWDLDQFPARIFDGGHLRFAATW